MEKKTHIELIGVAASDGFAFIPKLIEEKKASETILADESGETEERKSSETAKRKLNDGIVRSRVMAVAVSASEHEVRGDRNNEGENNKHRPRQNSRPRT